MNDDKEMRLKYPQLFDAEKSAMLRLKTEAAALHAFIDGLGEGCELSLAKTKIEEAVMWATKHITR